MNVTQGFVCCRSPLTVLGWGSCLSNSSRTMRPSIQISSRFVATSCQTTSAKDSVIQVSPLVPGNSKLKGTVRNEDPEAVQGQVKKVRGQPPSRYGRPVPAYSNEAHTVFADRWDQVINCLKGGMGRQPCPPCQLWLPPRMPCESKLWADQRHWVLPDLAALTVLVCHAANSRVLVVCFKVVGAVSALVPLRPAGCELRDGWGPLLLLRSRAQMTSLGGTLAFLAGRVTGVRLSSTVCFFRKRRCSSCTAITPNFLENHLNVSQHSWSLWGVTSWRRR